MKSNANSRFWVEKAREYTGLKVENRKTILFPAVAELLPLSKGTSRILDYGGGDGSFLASLNSKGEKCLFDPSPSMLEIAKARGNLIDRFYESVAELPNSYFDIVTLIHVVTVIEGDVELSEIFQNIRKVLKKGGMFVIGMTHPAFKNQFFSTFHTDYSTGKIRFDYLSSPSSYRVYLNTQKQNEFIHFECYHRPVSVVCNMLIDAGFKITQLGEIADTDFSNPRKKFDFPPFLVIKSET